jgi:hypothetical protein
MTEVARKLTAVELLERFAKDIEAFHRGGPNLRAAHVELIDELGLPEAAAAKWKEKVDVEWDAAELKAKRRAEPHPWLRLLGGQPKPAQAPANDPRPSEIETASNVSRKLDFAKELEEATEKQKADANLALKEIKAKRNAEPPEEEVGEAEPEIAGELVPLVTPEPDEEPISTEPVYTPRQVIALNRNHAVISNLGGKCVVMEFVPSSVTEGATEPSYQTFGNFKERYLNQYVTEPGLRSKPVPLGSFWLSHPRRRQYSRLDLVPHGPTVLPGQVFNLWRGFGVDPKEGDWSLLRNHVVEVLANGDQKFADYILRWTAWVLQNPGERPEAALVLRGGKGSGKGVWGDVLMIIFGEHGLQIFDPTHLTGKHNQHLQNKLFLFADEAFWAGDKTAERTLKGIVTEKRMMIEPKGVNAFPWPNRLSIYMAANADWVVPASHDERRYAVGNVNECWKQNEDYFIPLFAEIKAGGAAAMLSDLLKMDLGNWHPRKVPQTKALLEQKMLSLTGLEQWWVSMLDVGELPSPDKKNPRRVRSEALLEAAQKFSPRTKYINSTELGTFLDNMGCTHKSDGQKWGWIFPPLPEAREAWRLRSGGHWEFLEPNLDDWGAKPV